MMEEQIGFYIFSCFCDEQSCEACKEMNGTVWHVPRESCDPPLVAPLKVGDVHLKSCTSPEGCRCELIAVYKDEGTYRFYGPDDDWVYMPEIESLASRKFGEASSRQKSAAISLYRETRRKYLEAWSCEKEKNDISQAVSLYRETVQIHKSIGEMYSVDLDWAHMDYVLDRLTLVLAENGRPEEALSEVAAYRALGREAQPANTTWNAIVKRETRLRKRLVRQKAGLAARRKGSDSL